jgi:DNA-binding CsgD family transcriptional regulator
VWEISGGNAFYALELAQALARRGGSFVLGEVPLPTDLSALLAERLAALDPQARPALLTTALLADPTLELLDAVDGHGSWQRLEPAVAAGVVELHGSHVRFTHPLLAAAVATSADPGRKREVHRRLAQLAGDPEERARNVALSGEPPAEPVASRLDEAVAHALSRGASYAAAELAQEALRFTDAAGERWLERVFADCECRLRIGDTAGAEVRLRELLDTLPAGPERARALLLLVPSSRSGLTREDVERALADAGDDARLRALILLETMGSYSIVGLGLLANVEETAATLAEAIELARSIGDVALEARARGDLAWTDYAHGRPVDSELRLVAESRVLHELLLDPDRLRASQKMARGELAESERLLVALRERALREEEEYSIFVFTLQLFDLEARRGCWPSATRRMAELETVSAGIGAAQAAVLRCRAQLAAVRGDRLVADEAVAAVLASPAASGWQRLYALHVAGLAALAVGAASDAVAPLSEVASSMVGAGFRDPGAVPVVPDLIEALQLSGLNDEAARQLEWLETAARELDHPWGMALAARCRGLVHGDEAALVEAVQRCPALGLPFDRGRALLTLGQLQLRSRRRGDARRSLDEALGLFTTLEVAPWAERARGELARIGGRVASQDVLTPAGRRVAALVAEGLTNKEASAALFLSENTIESTLRRVYRKLGVRSRTELARHFR